MISKTDINCNEYFFKLNEIFLYFKSFFLILSLKLNIIKALIFKLILHFSFILFYYLLFFLYFPKGQK